MIIKLHDTRTIYTEHVINSMSGGRRGALLLATNSYRRKTGPYRSPTLPHVGRNSCGELATQLKDHDELLTIHDVEDDPITERPTPGGRSAHHCR